MKGMIYKDGKFISVLAETETTSLYGVLPRHEENNKPKVKKQKKSTKANKKVKYSSPRP